MASRRTRLKIRNLEKGNVSRCPTLKMCFKSKADAFDEAERMMEQGRVKPGCHITPYLCVDCHWWHVANRSIIHVDDPYKHAPRYS
jgi:hypothetical protein